MRLPDPQRSYAVLIGTSTYRSAELTDLPAVGNNLTALTGVLTDPTLGGLSAERCIVLPNPTDVRTVYRTLRQYASVTEDMLLVYFASHGRTGPRNELYLGLADTDPDELRVSALPFDLIREVLGDSPAAIRVLILDCCFSGRAIPDMGGPEEAVLGQVGIEGTYILAATPANAVALAPAGAAFTAFTGELLTLLHTGIPDGPELLTFAEIYRHLLHSMITRGLPRPGQRGTGNVDQLALTRNSAHPANPRSVGRAWPPDGGVEVQGDHGVEFRESMRHKMGSIAGTIGFGLLALFLISWFFDGPSTGVHGWDKFWVGLFALLTPGAALGYLFETLRPKLIVDGGGITLKYYEQGDRLRRIRFPWSELSTVEIRRRDSALVLVCTPKPGAIPADERAKKLWSDDLRGFVVIDVTRLRDSPRAVSAALTRYSAGRYRSDPRTV